MTLRVYSTEDADALSDATNESYDHLKQWMPWANQNQTVKQSEQICRRLMAAYYANEDYTLGIWDGDVLLGGTGFHLRCGPIEWRCAEIGMWIRSSVASQGWGTRALELMLEWGFTEWGWERLTWKCDTRNIASQRVAEKCGMTLEATFLSDALDVEARRRDTHQYVILKQDWLKR
jgi:ribosomal-protein-serine acetyltransferase